MPPTNHFANGEFHSSTVSHVLNQRDVVFGLLRPERLDVALGLLVDRGVADDGVARELLRWLEGAQLFEQVLDVDLVAHGPPRCTNRTRTAQRLPPWTAVLTFVGLSI